MSRLFEISIYSYTNVVKCKSDTKIILNLEKLANDNICKKYLIDKHIGRVCSENSYCWKYAVKEVGNPLAEKIRVYKAVATEIPGLCPGAKVALLG